LEPLLKQNSKNFVKSYLRSHFSYVCLGFILSLLLGIASAVLGAAIGPAFKALMEINSPDLVSFRELLGPSFGYLVERLTSSESILARELIQKLPYVLISLALFKAIIALNQWYLWELLSEKIARSLRFELIHRFSRLALTSRHQKDVINIESSLSSAISNDTRMFRDFIVHYYGGGPREAFQVGIGILTLFFLSPFLFGVCIFGVLPSVLILRRIGKKIHTRAGKALDNFSELGEWIQQRLHGIETIKHYRTEQHEIQLVQSKVEQLLNSFKQAAKIKSRTSPLLEAVAIIAMVVLLLLAFKSLESGSLSGSVFMSFFGSLALLSQAFSRLGKYYNINRESYAAIDRIRTWIEVSQQNENSEQISIPFKNLMPNELVISKLSFTYPNTSKPVLSDISFNFSPGKIYALAGASGAGKSTFLKILLGVLKPTSGEIYFANASPPKIGYMPQNVALFPGTILENLAWPLERISIDTAQNALISVGMWDFVLTLKDGLHHQFDYGSKEISGGQAQRLMLARIFCHQYDIVLIDEGTSAVDPESERIIIGGIRKLANNCILIMIAHRKSMLTIADEIVLFENSHIRYSGKYSDLTDNIEIEDQNTE
jgi:ABC-type multidrug transport system fused ATPase/permease subunit